ncbi:MAG: general secretion pathway protein GspB [Gammaproteobacteria bacterium]|nr:general secretion pathway protein GspB [Gammaproteobacteria bacterium]
MSYILDALRKSEQERQPKTPLRPGGPVHNVSLPWRGGWLLVTGAILLLVMLGVAVIFWHNTAGSLVTEAPVAAAVPVPTPSAATTAVVPPAAEPVAAALPIMPVKSEPPVRDLAEQAQVPVPVVPKKPVPAPHRKVAAVKQRSSPPADAPAVPLETDTTPLLQQMPLEMQHALPAMAVTIHVYSPQESQRILFINNREYHKGSLIEGGVRVEEIVPDGAVLSYHGERFKLPRPR